MKKDKGLPALSEAQMEVMHEVWAAEEATVTGVWEKLSQQRPLARNTVHTLMERLWKKGWLKRRSDGQAHYYSATSSRSNTLGNLVNRLIDTTFGGSAEGLVLSLLQGRKLSEEEAERIRRLIENRREKP